MRKKALLFAMLAILSCWVGCGERDKTISPSVTDEQYDANSPFTTAKLDGTTWVLDYPLNKEMNIWRFTKSEWITESRDKKIISKNRYYLSQRKPPIYEPPTFDSLKVGKPSSGEYMYVESEPYCFVKHLHYLSPSRMEFIYSDEVIDTYVRVE